MMSISKKSTLFFSLFVLIAGGCYMGATNPSFVSQAHARADVSQDCKLSIPDAVEIALPTVVNISTVRKEKKRMRGYGGSPFERFFFGLPPRQRPRGGASALGSGVIVSVDHKKVWILTNNHVVKEAKTIWVTLSNKKKYEAKILGTDPKSDLAVLQLKKPPKGLKGITFADSSRTRLGSSVIAIGNPFGVGQTVTAGIVSAKSRANVGIVDYEDFIQTDAAINPGNSGGALVNRCGELVGINTAILSKSGGSQGIGFAIPSNMARPIMLSLAKNGKVVRGWLGVLLQPLTPELAEAMNLSKYSGALISDVDPNGPAKKAGIQRGDFITHVNGQKVTDQARLRNIIAAAGAKARVTVNLIREGKQKTVKITLGELPNKYGGFGSVDGGSQGPVRVTSLNKKSRNDYGISSRINFGVVIESVAQGSLAERAGLRKGDVILKINRAKIKSVDHYHKLISGASENVLLLMYRNGMTHYLTLPKKAFSEE